MKIYLSTITLRYKILTIIKFDIMINIHSILCSCIYVYRKENAYESK